MSEVIIKICDILDNKKQRVSMKKIKSGYIITSSAFVINKNKIKYYTTIDGCPEVGDVVYGYITSVGLHSQLENKNGRIHSITEGTRGIFVFGNRYAPDFLEGIVDNTNSDEVDLLARSGVIGKLITKNSNQKDTTKVKIIGYVCDSDGNKINTTKLPILKKEKENKSKIILIIGTSMNSGKSQSASACCWTLSTSGYSTNGLKITGTASLKDILRMQDSGANKIADFTYLGYPSTYLLDAHALKNIFMQLISNYGNSDYLVVEIADGILQREVDILLSMPEVYAVRP